MLLVGEVVAKPLPMVLIMKVDRYYRGRGARYIAVDLTGWGPFSGWATEATGLHTAVALPRGFGLARDTCASGSLAVLDGYGEVTEPHVGVDLRSTWLLEYLLGGGAVVFLLLRLFERNKT